MLRWTQNHASQCTLALCNQILKLERIEEFVYNQVQNYLEEFYLNSENNHINLIITEESLKEDRESLEQMVKQSLQIGFSNENKENLGAKIYTLFKEILRVTNSGSHGFEKILLEMISNRISALYRIEYKCKNFDQVQSCY